MLNILKSFLFSSGENKNSEIKTIEFKKEVMEKNCVAESFRRWGYLQASLDPFNRIPPLAHEDLDNVSESEAKKWREIYCSSIGVEFMHIPYSDRCKWLASQMEEGQFTPDKEYILKRIASSEIFESYLHTRYVGNKRFSLEGLNVLIPALDSILDKAAELGFKHVLIGMAHRGRLNAMHHIAGTPASSLFAEFEDVDPRSVLGSGDVKYHKGATGTYKTASGKEIDVRFPSNPSHLEAVNPVLTGRVKAYQQRLGDTKGEKVMLVLLHGDAAFAGQGICAETLNFAELNGFNIGGTVHIIVNNMIGFTAEPDSYKSGRFASDIMKRLPAPIFHVNAEDPDSVDKVCRIATEYRQKFSSDVLIDLIGYRKYGHSEVDDPTATSPTLYEKIKNHPSLHEIYAEKIGASKETVSQIVKEVTDNFALEHEKGRSITTKQKHYSLPKYWQDYVGGAYDARYEVQTTISEEQLEKFAETAVTTPEGFNVHSKVQRLLEQRLEMSQGKRPIDWGMAETLAYASLLNDGYPVRIVGQDSRRGTFNHRHAALYDVKTREMHVPLSKINPDVFFEVYDSQLSEAAALGFEYGFSRDYPESLVCWEAQFGDFANGAQIIIDQFISAGEDKWDLLSGVVMMLPHGFEGQGPEHSSARLERYLQLAAEDNMQICYPSTAAQNFHMLRRQVLRKWRKPLIVMTPKSMLRAQAACSSLDDFTAKGFQNVITDGAEFADATRVLFCTGKIVHELRAKRTELGAKNTAIVAIEQLYPFPEGDVINALDNLPKLEHAYWIQEEPANMGALFFVKPYLEKLLGDINLTTIKRSASASPATGSLKAHNLEQQALLNFAFPG